MRLIATPNADRAALQAALLAIGASMLGTADLASGLQWHLRLPANQLAGVAIREDIIWIEPFRMLELQEDRANAILGITSATRPTWLNGAGQIIAITEKVNP